MDFAGHAELQLLALLAAFVAMVVVASQGRSTMRVGAAGIESDRRVMH